jgi:hypothetical protein
MSVSRADPFSVEHLLDPLPNGLHVRECFFRAGGYPIDNPAHLTPGVLNEADHKADMPDLAHVNTPGQDYAAEGACPVWPSVKKS